MSIDRKEIERIIDDFETKATRHFKELRTTERLEEARYHEGRKNGLEYAAAVLRQALHG